MESREFFGEVEQIEILYRENNAYYTAHIKKVEEESLVVSVPALNQESLFMQEGTEWFCRALLDNAFYYFSSTVTGRRHNGKSLLYLLSLPQKVTPHGRREYNRYCVNLKVYYWVLPDLLQEMEKEQQEAVREVVRQGGIRESELIKEVTRPFGLAEEATTADISGGGVLLKTSQRFPAGTGLLLQVLLEGESYRREVLVRGRVVWSLPAQGKNTSTCGLALQFENVSEIVREEITRFLYILSENNSPC